MLQSATLHFTVKKTKHLMAYTEIFACFSKFRSQHLNSVFITQYDSGLFTVFIFLIFSGCLVYLFLLMFPDYLFYLLLLIFPKYFFLSNATTCPCGLRGPPSWAWQGCNRLLIWDAHEAQLRCSDDVSGDIGGCSTRRALKPKLY